MALKKHGDSRDEHPLLASRTILRTVLDGTPAAVFLLDDDWKVVYRNRAAMDVLRNTIDTIGEQAMDELREEMFQRLRRTGSRYPKEELFRLPSRNGTVTLLISGTDVPGGVVTTWRNISAESEQSDVVAQLARELTGAGQSLSSTGQALAEATQVASRQAGMLSAGATQLTESIKEIATEASAAAHNSELAASTTRSAAEGMSALQQSTSAIAAMATTIRGIAEQTNLLALNATIEAARAGTAGSGFAVVAGEVKELARHTAEATEQIRALVDSINSSTRSAGESIATAAELIQDVASRQTSIASAVEEQSTVAASMAASVAEVVTATGSTAEGIGTTLSTAETLSENAARLRHLVSATA